MKQILLISIVTALVMGATGCGSLMARKAPNPGLGPYPGLRMMIALKNEKKPHWTTAIVYPLFVVDLPLSFEFDTVLLPLDILASISKGKDDKAAQPIPTPQP